MNKRLIIVVALTLVGLTVLAGGALYLNNRHIADEENSAEKTRLTDKNPVKTNETSSGSNLNAPGRYINYSPDIIPQTSGQKILFFHAPWCPQCRMIEADIKAQPSLPENTTIIKVDYDSNQALRQKYGVTLQTTFVLVDDSGNLVKKYVAYNEPTFQSLKDNLLN